MFTYWKSRKLQRGAAALEFAIVLPVLLMLLLGIVDFGMVMGAQTQVSNAAREGARTASLTGSKFEAETAGELALAGMPGATNIATTVVVTCRTESGAVCLLTDSDPDTGSKVTISITYLHTWLSPVLLGLTPTIVLNGQSQMRIEAP